MTSKRRGSLWSALEVYEGSEEEGLKDRIELERHPSSDEVSGPPIHVCPEVEEEKKKKEQQNTSGSSSNSRLRSNKVGVGDDWIRHQESPPKEKSPAPTQTSAKFRVASGLSQFQEVDFSEPPYDNEGRVGLAPEYVIEDQKVPNGMRQVANGMRVFGGYDGPGCSTGESSDDDDAEGDAKAKKAEPTNSVKVSKKGKGKRKESLKTSNSVTFKTSDDGEGDDIANEPNERLRGIREKSATIRGAGSIGNIAVVAAVGRRNNFNPYYPQPGDYNHPTTSGDSRYNSGASTSKGVSRDSSFTDATDITSGSIRDDTTVTIDEDQSEDSKNPPFRMPGMDVPKPFATPTSLAIYTQIHRNGVSKLGTRVLTTAVIFTFIITIVLTVLILVAPKTLSEKPEVTYIKASTPVPSVSLSSTIHPSNTTHPVAPLIGRNVIASINDILTNFDSPDLLMDAGRSTGTDDDKFEYSTTRSQNSVESSNMAKQYTSAGRETTNTETTTHVTEVSTDFASKKSTSIRANTFDFNKNPWPADDTDSSDSQLSSETTTSASTNEIASDTLITSKNQSFIITATVPSGTSGADINYDTEAATQTSIFSTVFGNTEVTTTDEVIEITPTPTIDINTVEATSFAPLLNNNLETTGQPSEVTSSASSASAESSEDDGVEYTTQSLSENRTLESLLNSDGDVKRRYSDSTNGVLTVTQPYERGILRNLTETFVE